MGWTIHQSGTYGSLSDFTDHSLRIYIDSLKLTIIAKAPKWNACVFNKRLKTCLDLPYKDWQKMIGDSSISSHQDGQGKFVLIAKTTGKTMAIHKHNCLEFLIFRKTEPQKQTNEEKVSELWAASDIKAPSPVARIYCRRFGMAEQRGIPLKVNRCNSNGKMIPALETISIERHMIPASTFAPLPDYKKAKNMAELIIGKSGSKDLADILDTSDDELQSKQKVETIK